MTGSMLGSIPNHAIANWQTKIVNERMMIMAKPKVGVLVVGPFNSQSIEPIEKLCQGAKVFANEFIGIPYHKTVFKNPKDGEVLVPTNVVPFKPIEPMQKVMAILMQMVRQCDRIAIVGKKSDVILPALIAARMIDKKFVRIITNGTIYPVEVVYHISREAMNKAQNDWVKMMGVNKSNEKDAEVDAHTTDEPKPEDCFKSPNGAQLFPYQQQMVNFVLKVKRAGLFVDMGLGKTFATLATIDKLTSDGSIDKQKPILVVAPKMVALDTWSREADKWGYDMAVKVNIALGKKKRDTLLESLLEPCEKTTLLTTNPEQLPQILDFFHNHGIFNPFAMVVVDELSQYKNAGTKRFQSLRDISDHVDYFIGLTGTPNPNNLLDIWSQMMVIDPKNGSRFGYKFFSYRQKYFRADVVGNNGVVYKWALKNGAKERIYEQMKPTVISMQSDGLVDLPKITYNNQYVKLPKKAQKLYHELDESVRKQLREHQDDNEAVSYDGDDTELEIANSAVLASRLMQVTSGAVYDATLDEMELDDVDYDAASELNVDTSKYQVIHDAKLVALKEMIENATSPILVFFQFKSEIVRMKDYFDFEYLDPHRNDIQDVIKRWNQGDVPVLVAHPAAAGHGLNLQDGGHTMVWYTPTWSNEQYRQAVKRLYRRGQKHPVSIIHLVAEDTIDEQIIQRLTDKEAQQSDLMESLDIRKHKRDI